tara:strand:- start:231 stop:350 length:120 start_codon:yes stop_codon:yes gene_type:complete
MLPLLFFDLIPEIVAKAIGWQAKKMVLQLETTISTSSPN